MTMFEFHERITKIQSHWAYLAIMSGAYALYASWLLVPVRVTLSGAGLFGLGILTVTWLEYALHRWVFHNNWKNGLGDTIRRIHGRHHRQPRVVGFGTVPPHISFILVAGSYGFWSLVFGPSQFFLAGLCIGYTLHELTHFAAHHADGRFFQALRAYHGRHHESDSRRSYGLICSVWDRLFNTY